VLAYVIAALVAVQAAVVVWAIAGLGAWIEDGGVLDAATMESEEATFTEGIGFGLHFLGGTILIPLAALALLIVSFFAKVPKGPVWAAATLGLVVLQVVLGMTAGGLPLLGLLHGLNALALFTVAGFAARQAGTPRPVVAPAT
jgi:hypothetical protein